MSDVFKKSKRSEVMSLIRSTGNRETELRLISLFREEGIPGWRRGRKGRLRREETLKAES